MFMRLLRDSLRAVLKPVAIIWDWLQGRSTAVSGGDVGVIAQAGYGLGFLRTRTAPGWRKLVRWGVVALGFAAYFGLQLVLAYLCNQLMWVYIIAFMIMIACLVFAAAKPAATFIFWLAFSPLGFIFLRMDFGAGLPAITFDRVTLAALSFFLILRTLLNRHRIKRPIAGEWFALIQIAYIMLALFVMKPGNLPSILRTLSEKFDHIALALVAYFIAKSVLRTRKQLVGALIALLVAGVYSALSAFYEHYTGLRWFSSFLPVEFGLAYADIGRASGPLINPSALGTFLGLTAFLSYHFYATTQRKSLKGFLLVLMLLQLIGCYFTYTRGAYVGPALLLVGMPFAAIGYRKQYVGLFLVAVVSMIIAAPIVMSNRNVHSRLTKESTVLFRVAVTASTFNIIKHHPLFGIGLGEIDNGLEKYMTNAGALSGWYARGIEPSKVYPQRKLWKIVTSHNSLLTIFAEEGIVGGMLYVGCFVAFLVHLIKVRARLPDKGVLNKDLVSLLILACVGHFLACLTYDIRFFKYPNYVLWATYAIVIRLGEILNEEAHAQKSHTKDQETPVLTHT